MPSEVGEGFRGAREYYVLGMSSRGDWLLRWLASVLNSLAERSFVSPVHQAVLVEMMADAEIAVGDPRASESLDRAERLYAASGGVSEAEYLGLPEFAPLREVMDWLFLDLADRRDRRLTDCEHRLGVKRELAARPGPAAHSLAPTRARATDMSIVWSPPHPGWEGLSVAFAPGPALSQDLEVTDGRWCLLLAKALSFPALWATPMTAEDLRLVVDSASVAWMGIDALARADAASLAEAESEGMLLQLDGLLHREASAAGDGRVLEAYGDLLVQAGQAKKAAAAYDRARSAYSGRDPLLGSHLGLAVVTRRLTGPSITLGSSQLISWEHRLAAKQRGPFW